MTYTTYYSSPLGKIILVSDGAALTELDFAEDVPAASVEHTQKDLPVFEEVSRWLDVYFAGRDPGALPPLAPHGTAFQQAVWKVLRGIPYGTTTTYGRIAAHIAAARGGSPRILPPHAADGCRRRPSAVRSGATRSPSSFPVTA